VISPSLRSRLSRIARGESGEPANGPGATPPGWDPVPPPRCEPELLPYAIDFDPERCGRAVATGSGIAWEVEVPLYSWLSSSPGGPGGAVGPAAGAAELFLDIETSGLSAAPLFLIGLLELRPDAMRLRQFFARDYAEEAAVLQAFAEIAREPARWITFNGASFDLPYIRDRSAFHGIETPAPVEHLDLLVAARRRWKNSAPDCRLQTLEEVICGRRRLADIPGEAIAGVYHAFVGTSAWGMIAPVLHHNALDILTMYELRGRLAGPTPGANGPARTNPERSGER
jgi:uncharacterized protein YprB with RNaseH-like and TPR domain